MRSSRPLRTPDSPWAYAAAKGWHELIDAGVLLNPRLAHTPIESGPKALAVQPSPSAGRGSLDEHTS